MLDWNYGGSTGHVDTTVSIQPHSDYSPAADLGPLGDAQASTRLSFGSVSFSHESRSPLPLSPGPQQSGFQKLYSGSSSGYAKRQNACIGSDLLDDDKFHDMASVDPALHSPLRREFLQRSMGPSIPRLIETTDTETSDLYSSANMDDWPDFVSWDDQIRK